MGVGRTELQRDDKFGQDDSRRRLQWGGGRPQISQFWSSQLGNNQRSRWRQIAESRNSFIFIANGCSGHSFLCVFLLIYSKHMEPTSKQTASKQCGYCKCYISKVKGASAHTSLIYRYMYMCAEGHVQPLWVILETSHRAGGGKSLPLGGWTLGGIANPTLIHLTGGTHPSCGVSTSWRRTGINFPRV